MIEITNGNFNINEIKILSNISLSIMDGEIVSIIGPGGSSKTALLKMIAYQLQNMKCNYVLDRSPISSSKDKNLKQQFEIMHTTTPENKDEKLIDFLMLARSSENSLFQPISEFDIQIVDDYLKFFKMTDLAENEIQNLSSTELKKMLIIYSMVKEKKYLLMDDPFCNIDMKSTNSLYFQMKKYVNKGVKNIIFTTHNINNAVNISDKIIVIKKGVIEKICTPDVIDEEDIKKIFDVDVMKSKNIYNGKSEFHLFPEI